MEELDLVAIVAATAASFAFGALWYSPAVLAPLWARESGIDPGTPMRRPARTFGLAAVFTLLSCTALALLVGPAPSVLGAAGTGAMLGACIAAASLGINYEFCGRGLLLLAIDGCFHTARLAIAGAVLGAIS